MRRVVEPLLSGGGERASTARDIEYVRDLGLIARDDPPRIANPVYAEVVPRELTSAFQSLLLEETAWYVDSGGGLDVDKLLGAFQAFFREHSEHWLGRFDYAEAGPQLIVQGFLQRVVNGGGRIEREYGLGRGGPTCSSCGRGAGKGRRPGRRWTGTSSSARCCTRAWSGPSPRVWSRRRRTWTGAMRGRGTWSCSTGTRDGRGRRRSSGARSTSASAPSPCGGCRRSGERRPGEGRRSTRPYPGRRLGGVPPPRGDPRPTGYPHHVEQAPSGWISLPANRQ